ncbi:MAG: 2-oxoacid:acceptor oxidoreductase family protein [Thermoplasmata archaeon]|nr:2-oxoacid:acceptor oxidoreductase family protein [Thermoplasmata archaeon]
MIEIRFHGRGGQGAVVASRLLAVAAAGEGKDVQSFPFFGVERRGAPVTAFTKIDSGRIYVKSMIYEPDYVVVMDPSLLTAVDVTSGLKEDGVLLVNSGRSPEEMKEEVGIERVAVVNATEIAIRNRLGSRENPIVNTAILGALARVSGVVSLDSVKRAIDESAPRKKEENKKAAEDAWNEVVFGFKGGE